MRPFLSPKNGINILIYGKAIKSPTAIKFSLCEQTKKATGWDSISAKVFDGFEIRQVRGKYFYGKENAQAEFNLGYDFKQGSFGGLGVNVPHFNLGADYFPLSNSTYDTFIQFDTLTLSGSSNNKIRCQHNQERLDVSAIDPSVPGC